MGKKKDQYVHYVSPEKLIKISSTNEEDYITNKTPPNTPSNTNFIKENKILNTDSINKASKIPIERELYKETSSINYINIMENKEIADLNDILSNDDKLLFSLNALGSLQKNEKLTEKGNLLSIDDRWLFQGIRRWWSEDSREKSSNKTLLVVSAAADRIAELLNEDYLSSQGSKNKTAETQEEKNNKEKNEERKRILNKYNIAINKAKIGIENCRDTYDDKFTKNTLNLSIQKTEDIIDKLQKYNI